MPRILAAIFVFAVLSMAPVLGALAQALPQEMMQQIGAAAEQGRQHRAAISDIIDERRQTANRQLETVVVAAINQRPDLFQAIMREAQREAPESSASLNMTVRGMFPGFAGTLRSLSPAPLKRATVETPRILATSDPRSVVLSPPPPEQRPRDWPIFVSEGGVDGYADKDPFEALNRVFFYTNGALDFLIFELLARGYRFVTPDAVQDALGRSFDNLSSPITFANDLLQLRFHRAATTFSRFAINSTVGVLGLFDVAAELGLEAHDADFGQTLHYYGVGDGIYLMLPLFGPTTARDAIGLGVDSFLDPRTWFLGTTERYALFAGEGVVRREELIEAVDFLVEFSDSNYDDVRAWTFQQRQAELAE